MAEQAVGSPVEAKMPSGSAGIRLYSPIVIATYAVLGGFPIGCALYGLNSARRGSRVVGRALYVVAAASCLLMVVGMTLDLDVRVFGILGIFGAIGLYNLESGPFERAVRTGAIRAKWWPPAVVVLSAYLIGAIVKVSWGW